MNYKNYLKCFELALNDEIKYLRNKGSQKTYLTDGLYLGSRKGQYIYSFTAETEILFPDDTLIDLEFNRKKYTGTILSSEGFEIVLSLAKKIGDRIATAILLTSPWFLLEELKKRLEEVYTNKISNKQIAEQVLQISAKTFNPNFKRFEPILARIQKRLEIAIQCDNSQKQAIEKSLNQNVSFIWGPPGTGKTSTLGLAVTALVQTGESVLVVAHSNTAVDTAMKSVATYLRGYSLYEEGFVLRHGIATPQSLDDFPQLNARNILRQQHPKLVENIELLEKQKRNLIKNSRQGRFTVVERQQIQSELSIVKRKIKVLRDRFRQLEIELIAKAEVVGCTFSKAAIAAEVYQRAKQFDAVVIDEASMAYIPHCFFVSTLAKRRILIFGDFRQLSPISQAKTEATKEWLEKDIFDRAGISKKIDRGQSDERLILLDTQYRMNPAISEIPNRLFYQGMLKNGSQVEVSTHSIANKAPSAGSVLAIYDTSYLSAFCIKETQSHSRFNFISAFVTVELALESFQANHLSIGIITPYNAQARLIKNILKDLSIDKKIKIATVHRFQGSEQDVIIFDAVEGKPQANIGLPVKGGMLSSAARLANVAISRARGKFITVVNDRYIAEKLDSFSIFKKFIERIKARATIQTLKWQEDNPKPQLLDSLSNISLFHSANEALSSLKSDLDKAESEIAIYWSSEQIQPFFPLNLLKTCSDKRIRFFLSGTGRERLEKKLHNTQIFNTSLKATIGLIGIDKKSLWIYLNTATASSSVLKINSPQTINLLYGFFSLIPHSDPGSTPEDLNRCQVCKHPLWIRDGRFGAYLACTKSSTHPKQKITANSATTIARIMNITCGDCGSQVKGCKSANNNNIFLACTSMRCKWTKSLKSII